MAKSKEPTEKKIIIETLTELSIHDFEGDLSEVLNLLQGLKSRNVAKYGVCIDLELDWYDSDSSPAIIVRGHRFETDKEFSERRKEYFEALQRKKDKKAKSEAEERKLYEQLKRKFGS